MVQGLGVWGLGFYGSGFRVWASGFRLWGSRFKVRLAHLPLMEDFEVGSCQTGTVAQVLYGKT